MEKEYYNGQYIPMMRKLGKGIGFLGIACSLLPALVLGIGYGIWPDFAALIPAFISTASVFGVFWFLEPIIFYPILGEVGTYMAFLSGNINNMRIPCASMAQVSAEVEPGTPQGSIIATLGMGTSIIINIAVLTLGVILGSGVLSMLPADVVNALNYILPALFGALFMQYAFAKRTLSAVMIATTLVLCTTVKAGVFSWLPGASNWIMLACVFGAIAFEITKKPKKA